MEQVSLNLARKWRSAQFSEIIGQDLVVRILQNSLFKNQFFPVYLLSGQRGCGKTSTARVFAAAVNCANLFEFQKNSKIAIPCLNCVSCLAMKKGQHPDFIEIDAASYTGVDNIRNIIDTSSFLPVLGHKKIYLIDEVHMLSKAAFNALLKILEEPSKSVLFILATTEIQKIPDTVRSRCFQLLFNPVVDTQVVHHLEMICKKENISYDVTGLETIAHATQGSLRDAINLLEQARFAENSVTKSVVVSVLGYVEDIILYELLSAMMNSDIDQIIATLKCFDKKTISVEYVVKRLLELLYDFILMKYGADAKYGSELSELSKQQIEAIHITKLLGWFDEFVQLDTMLSKTSKKQLLLESLLIRLVTPEYQDYRQEGAKKKNNIKIEENNTIQNSDQQLWKTFVMVVSAHIDPILASILHATDMELFDRQRHIIEIRTLKKFVLFQDLFVEQKKIYQQYLDQVFGYQVTLVVQFNKVEEPIVKNFVSKNEIVENKVSTVKTSSTVKTANDSNYARKITQRYQTPQVYDKNEVTVDVADVSKWKVTHMLLEHFGGTVREIIKDPTDEFNA
ncbi:DNA polymerase III subunit gamma/tau [Candidatus Dependentiae bacterium]|nr:DNA polymerase III subunit gamma/tau [Candidatus Dependentiae bacterium]